MILGSSELNQNLLPNRNFFQTRDITNYIFAYLRKPVIQTNIISANPFRERYNNNNDVFIHIRLTDVADKNPGSTYYLNTLSLLSFDNIYIATDDPSHSIVRLLQEKYPDVKLIQYNEPIQIMQFGSTCKNIILSHGSFSSIIGYLAFDSSVYFPQYEHGKIWYGDMFTEKGWNCIQFLENATDEKEINKQFLDLRYLARGYA
jgi:hypothetical protein